MLKVIIIDSGVNKDHKRFQNEIIRGYTWESGMLTEELPDDFGHGTAIYGIISKNCNAEILNIRIKDIENGIDNKELCRLLEYINKNIPCDIVNMSIGTDGSENNYELYEACKKLTNNGVIVISAFNNNGTFSYPAAFDNVIGVISEPTCLKSDSFIYIDDTIINICAKGGTQRVCWNNPEYIYISGNSFACANLTAILVNLYDKTNTIKIDYRQAIKLLKDNAIEKRSFNESEKITEKYNIKCKKVVLFPFAKEMHALLRYPELLDFEIVAVYDTKYSGRLGADTNKTLKKDSIHNYKIRNIDNIDWDEFDTIIIGHCDELSMLIHRNNINRKLIEMALKNKKNVYSLDECNFELGEEQREHFYCPRVDKGNVSPNRFGMLYTITKPVVGIFGTSSKQGKFTLQLEIRKRLLEIGYNVGQIGTEPTSKLFGIDVCFPMGYNSTVSINGDYTIRYLNEKMHRMCIEGDEIILVGSQSGTINFDYSNLKNYTLQQYEFLVGTKPDVVVLCVNSFDEIDYINRTIRFIESAVECKILALVVFPIDMDVDSLSMQHKHLLTYGECESIKKKYEKEFNINVYMLNDDENLDELVDNLTEYFSE